MTIVSRISSLVGGEESGVPYFRRRRFAIFLDLIDSVLAVRENCRIIDIGGEPEYWRYVGDLLGDRRIHVTFVNQMTFDVSDDRYVSVIGDARHLESFADMSFDVVHSNSVIEHVGRWSDMAAMAQEVQRLAPSYFVQTPYFWFPIEPHCSSAFFHWMPESIRVRMLMRRPRGQWGKAPDVSTAMRQIQSAVLLDYQMMRTLFPDATICRERILGVTKSLIAVRKDPRSQKRDETGARP